MRVRFNGGTLAVLLVAGALVAGQSVAACSSGRDNDPAGSGRPGPSGDLYLLRANGILCITYPCFSIDAVPLNTPDQFERVSDVDFSPLNLPVATRDSLLTAVMDGWGVTAAGRFEVVQDAGPAGEGRVFRVTFVKGLAGGGE